MSAFCTAAFNITPLTSKAAKASWSVVGSAAATLGARYNCAAAMRKSVILFVSYVFVVDPPSG